MPPTPTLLPHHTGPRLVLYAQTHHDGSGNPISLLPLITQNTGVTHVIVAAIHLNEGPGNITLNDDPPSAEKFKTLWSEVKWLQGTGVKVLGMLGGAARGSFERLSGGDESFESYYRPLHAIISTHALDGLDLDVEEQISLSTAQRLIHRLRSDFGPQFLITLAPVATALLPDPAHAHLHPRPLLSPNPTPNPLHPTLPHLSGFSYPALENSPAGQEVSWYNTQFYCGWGDAGSSQWYDAIVAAGWHPRKVVVGVVTNPGNGAGYVELRKLREVLGLLRARYKDRGEGFGGVMGWEYFNAGGGEDKVHLQTVSNGADGQAGWVGGLGTVLRTPDPPASTAPGLSGANLGQIIASLPTPPVSWPVESIESLTVIGFSRQEAVAALNATDGNVEIAAGLLFES
ncbi:glycoside hydrolase [Mytilinidion resinicola]|uniref:chitinase n=1 Tax=Mytilinidion resinicola TaxID=574789 RepID=A0A6A6Y3Z8_9PEZI|nr:glycoside hydrolase [Mytilinidion resinicola]KAF2802507.1 glycoside hydrolase [Mytilinidion resinicola]